MEQLGLFALIPEPPFEEVEAPEPPGTAVVLCADPLDAAELEKHLARVVIWAARAPETDAPPREDILRFADVLSRYEEKLKFAAFWRREAMRTGREWCVVYAQAQERLAREMKRDPEYFAKLPADRTDFMWFRERKNEA